MSRPYTDPRWLTYKQAVTLGAQVRKGEKSTLVQYWKFTEEYIKKDDSGNPVLNNEGQTIKEQVRLERPRVFYASVFNAEQVDNLPELSIKAPDWDPLERAEHILQVSNAMIRHGEVDRAFYRPSTDSIHLPHKHQFPTPDRYYATALHELGHWTGHELRLNRDLAHPLGRLREPQALHWHGCADVDVHRLRDLWRIGIAAEIGGSLKAALHSVVEHVRQRQQFGRPLGSPQAVQHRLAAASSKLQGARLLMLAAAASGDPAQAAMGVGAAQSLSTPVVYDLHQFMGAMGLTLEHPLHRWTYRVRLLRSELGGADQHFERLADLAWSPAAG